MSTPPRERAERIIRYLAAGGWSHPAELEDRIAEEIGDALNELREGFLRKPDARGAPR